MEKETLYIVKSSGEKVKFSMDKLSKSLQKTGASNKTVEDVLVKVKDQLYQGVSTKLIYNKAFALLKKKKSHLASKYKLKKAIYELGPTGFPFERFISSILKFQNYQTEVNKILQGECVSHEIDVIAYKNNEATLIECKFHKKKGVNCNVKVPLYINSRYQDVKAHWETNSKNETAYAHGWVVTNTRFTQDAMAYGNCCGLFLLSWDYPKNDGLKDRIDRFGLFPITVSTILTKREIQFLLSRDIILCKELIGDVFYLDHLGISKIRKEKILDEIIQLCNS